MKKMGFLMHIGLLAMAAGFSAIVMLLWNWLMPVIFGLTIINFWQALGLLLLTRILFGGFGFIAKHMMGDGGRHHGHMHKKWMKMTPEQRKEFIKRRQQFGFDHHYHQEWNKDNE